MEAAYDTLEPAVHHARYQEPELSDKDPAPFPLVASFVDVLLWGEWTAGFLLEVGEEQATVVLNGPYLEDKRIQVPIESIAVFRSRTSRSSLTSHLDACIWKYAQIDLCRELQYFLHTPNISEERLVQIFAGVLPVGCALWSSSLPPEEWDKEPLALICMALTEFLARVGTAQVSIATFTRTWRSVPDAETIVFPLSKTLPEFPDLLKAHFLVIALEDCPSCVVSALKDLMSYCSPPLLAWIIPDNTELPKIVLRKSHLYPYGQAAIKYLKYCIDNMNWSESIAVFLQVLIVNAQSVPPILNSENLNSFLRYFTPFEVPPSSKTNLNVALLLFSPPNSINSLSVENKASWAPLCSKACEDILSAAPVSTSLAFLLNCESTKTDSHLHRLVAGMPISIFATMVTRASEGILIPLCRVLKDVFSNWDSAHDQIQEETDQVGTLRYFLFIQQILGFGTKYPEHWKNMLREFLCPELTLFFDSTIWALQDEKVQEALQTVIAIEQIILESICDDTVSTRNMLVAHLEVISAKTCPYKFVRTFKFLRPYCDSFESSRKCPQLRLAYICAHLVYSIRSKRWSEVVTILISLFPIDSQTHYNNMFEYMQVYVQKFEPAFKGGSLEMLQLFFPLRFEHPSQLRYDYRYSADFQHFATLTSFLCFSFLDYDESRADSDRVGRVAVELLEDTVKQIVLKLPRHLVVFLWFTLRRHRTHYYVRAGEEFATGVKLQRQFSLWIYEKTKWLKGISMNLMREVVLFI